MVDSTHNPNSKMLLFVFELEAVCRYLWWWKRLPVRVIAGHGLSSILGVLHELLKVGYTAAIDSSSEYPMTSAHVEIVAAYSGQIYVR